MLIKICVRNLKFPIYIPQIKDFDIVIFSVATDFNVLYDVRDSLKILMAVCCVHIFFEIRVFKNINFLSCESRIRLWYPTRFRDAARYWSEIIFLRYLWQYFLERDVQNFKPYKISISFKTYLLLNDCDLHYMLLFF